jgi:hypothetical protein
MSEYPDERTVQEWNELDAALDADAITPPETEWPDLPAFEDGPPARAWLTPGPDDRHPEGGFEPVVFPGRDLTADELAQIEGGWPSMPEAGE